MGLLLVIRTDLQIGNTSAVFRGDGEYSVEEGDAPFFCFAGRHHQRIDAAG